jgi:tRNA modification GTPase
MPSPSETIVAVSTAWQPASVGVLRLSGQDAFTLTDCLDLVPPQSASYPRGQMTRLKLAATLELPAFVIWWRAPRSYTGQDVIELHVPGAPPLLRLLADRLIAAGARRALPGEFTARAYLSGRLGRQAVAGVLDLLHARNADELRAAARCAQLSNTDENEIADRLTGLLAKIEAGIDFVDEEDVTFVSPSSLAQALEQLISQLAAKTTAASPVGLRPHVALVGMPNAGKSTLFNALLGEARALVSPIVGTTRDVLSSTLNVDGVEFVLQDCAGLGYTASDLELAAHLASERVAALADLVLWVHSAEQHWQPDELRVLAELVPRRLLVCTKTDLAPAHFPPGETGLGVSVEAHTGLAALKDRIIVLVSTCAQPGTRLPDGDTAAAVAALERARALVSAPSLTLHCPELIALELRDALDRLLDGVHEHRDEQVLARIFGEFCVGK